MSPKLRVLPLLLLVILALSVPALAQDATPEAMSTDSNGMITYAAPNCDYGGEFQSIAAVDANTVVMKLCHGDAALPSKVAFAAFAVHSYAQLQATGGGGPDLINNPIGTGPWKLDHWDQGNEIVYTRNDNYWGDKAQTSQMILRWSTEAAARLNELQAGTVDGIENVGPNDFDTIKNDPSLNLIPVEGLNIMYLGINNTVKPFDDVRVRQALAYGVDKQRLIDNFYPPGSTVADQFMPTAIFGYTSEVQPFPYDQDKAKSLLAAAAADDGFTLPIETTLSYRDVVRSYLPQPGVVAADIQQQLAAIGINVTIDVQESTTFLDNASAGKLSLHLLGWGVDYPDATDFLDYHFGGGASAQFGDKFPDIVQALAQGGQLADPTARYPFYVTANTAIRDEVPMVPMAHGGFADAFRADITNVSVSPLANINFAKMQNPDADSITYMQGGEPGSLYCNDETDGESFTACQLVNESLLAYEDGGTAVVPGLASSYEASDDLLTWTFHLRPGVTFTDGTPLTANDAVMSYAVAWDAANPLHVGRTGVFDYWSSFFGFMNAPAS